MSIPATLEREGSVKTSEIKAPTPEAFHQQAVEVVTDNLKVAHSPIITPQHVQPLTAESPIPNHPAFPVGTERVGSLDADIRLEEKRSKARDFQNHIVDFIGKFKGGHTDKRVGQAGGIGTRGVFGRIKARFANRGRIDHSGNELE